MNEENLKKGKATRFTSGAVAAENGRKGGWAKARNARARKALSEIAAECLSKKLPDGSLLDALHDAGLATEKNLTVGAAYVYSVLKSAMEGNAQAMRIVLDLVDENPEFKHKKDMDKKLLKLKEREVSAKEEGW